MTNIADRFMASHSGSGLWHILDTEASEDTAEVLCNIVPIGFTGDLDQLADVPTYDTSDVPDLIKMLNYAVEGISMGGWEVGRPVTELVAEAEEILTKVAPWSQLCPDGRQLYYEGDNPDGFAETVLSQFGFDPSDHESWSDGYGFWCPPEHLDALYGDETFRRRFPIGS